MAENDDELARAMLDGSRFAHLLKPIRDLAENWGVDIANDLEDYLTHLNRTAFTFDGGPKLDFAEAALVIQSSACVYSRKVDFLHTLVYQALEAVRTKKGGAAGGPEGADDPAEGAVGAGATQKERVSKRDQQALEPEDDTLDGFLSTGLNLKQAEDIDLGQDEAPPAAYVRPPAALLALEDQCSGSGDGDAGFCRLAHCFVHISGALLLDANDAEMYDQMLNNTVAGKAAQQAWIAPEAVLRHAGQPGQAVTTLPQQGQQGEDEDDEGGAQGGGMSDDDDAPAQPAATQEQPATQPGASQQPAAADAAAGAQPAAPVPVPHGAPQGAHADPVATQAQGPGAEEEEAEAFDLYKPLDMDGKGTLPIKPMQVKRPARGMFKAVVVQPALGPSRAVQRACPHTALVNPEFAYGLELMIQLCPPPQAGRAGRKALQQGSAAAAGARAVFDAADAAAAMADLQGVIEDQQQQQEVAGGADGQQAAGGAGGDWADEAGGGDAGGFDDEDYGGGGGDAYGSGLDIMDLVNQGMLQQGARHLDGDGVGGGPVEEGSSYEELCRAHMDAMMATAAAQEVQTELAMRVSGWRSKIDPVLRDEEGRRGFDIQLYQQKIIGRLDNNQQQDASALEDQAAQRARDPADFSVVASQSVKWEVSRTFAAMLQLINNRNVAIHQDGPPDAPFSLQLLNPELLHKSMGQRLGGAAAAGPGAASAGAENDTDMVPVEATDGEEHADAPRAAAAARRPSKKARG